MKRAIFRDILSARKREIPQCSAPAVGYWQPPKEELGLTKLHLSPFCFLVVHLWGSSFAISTWQSFRVLLLVLLFVFLMSVNFVLQQV